LWSTSGRIVVLVIGALVLIERIIVLRDFHFAALLIALRVISRGACTASWHGELTVEASAFP
jgi:hypothetical protein